MSFANRSLRRAITAMLLSVGLLLPLAPGASAATPHRVYFPTTGHYLAYGFLDYWLQHGGIPIFGYPITEEFQQNGMTVQYFERAVFEYHPNNSPGWRVEPRLLGSLQTAGRQNETPFQPLQAQSDENCTFYSATNHRLCFGFRDYWEQHGGLPVFGYPISEEFTENGFTVQYFERARFEWHPDNPPAWQVELGLLGDQSAQQDNVNTAPLSQGAGVPVYAPELWPTCTPAQLQAGEGFAEGAAGTILQVMTLQNTSGDTCTLNGFPGMQLLDAQGNALPTNVHWGGGGAYPILDVPVQTVYLIPGDSASYDMIYHHIIPAGSQSCYSAAQLEITPPNDFDHLTITAGFQVCGGDLYVSPVVRGTQGVGISPPCDGCDNPQGDIARVLTVL